MITQIHVLDVLVQIGNGRRDLVTRSTGRAVRTSIEQDLARLTGRTIVVLDFSDVRVMDCSCADEIVAKLVAASLAAQAPLDAFFLVRGLDHHHFEEIEEVLRRQRLALVAETPDGLRLLGEVDDVAQQAFMRLAEKGGAAPEDLASDLAWSLELARAVLDDLAVRRLVLQDGGVYLTPNAAA